MLFCSAGFWFFGVCGFVVVVFCGVFWFGLVLGGEGQGSYVKLCLRFPQCCLYSSALLNSRWHGTDR